LDAIGALISPEAEEIDDERDDRDEVSEIIDSGEDIEETELAREDRRWSMCGCGDEDGHLSVACEEQTVEAWAMA
jgi:hypothetical protein